MDFEKRLKKQSEGIRALYLKTKILRITELFPKASEKQLKRYILTYLILEKIRKEQEEKQKWIDDKPWREFQERVKNSEQEQESKIIGVGIYSITIHKRLN